jgi:ubiquinone/menaquinone biosynthesis C-methylase UbiE
MRDTAVVERPLLAKCLNGHQQQTGRASLSGGRVKDQHQFIQQDYYAKTSAVFDEMHACGAGEHDFALAFMVAMVDHLGIQSVLDVGAGTGRALLHLTKARPHLRIHGVEPVAELRSVAYSKGVKPTMLTEGDGARLAFDDGAFDLVCEFGVLHHVQRPHIVVGEMLRVGRKAIFLSDSNNFGQGPWLARSIKQALNGLGLWGVANYLKTGGKGYSISAGDGLGYSYSIFNNLRQIQQQCQQVHLLNTRDGGRNIYRTASHVALLGIMNEVKQAI